MIVYIEYAPAFRIYLCVIDTGMDTGALGVCCALRLSAIIERAARPS